METCCKQDVETIGLAPIMLFLLAKNDGSV